MNPDEIYMLGIIISISALSASIIVFSIFVIYKKRLDKKLDVSYGKMRKI